MNFLDELVETTDCPNRSGKLAKFSRKNRFLTVNLSIAFKHTFKWERIVQPVKELYCSCFEHFPNLRCDIYIKKKKFAKLILLPHYSNWMYRLRLVFLTFTLTRRKLKIIGRTSNVKMVLFIWTTTGNTSWNPALYECQGDGYSASFTLRYKSFSGALKWFGLRDNKTRVQQKILSRNYQTFFSGLIDP